jgi:hypothetical protein
MPQLLEDADKPAKTLKLNFFYYLITLKFKTLVFVVYNSDDTIIDYT